MTCLLSFRPEHPQYKVILLVNKDDYYIKPLVLPHVWKDNSDIMDAGVIAPKDLSDSNTSTWFGVTTSGRYAILTMVRTRADVSTLRHGKQATRTGEEPKRRRVRVTTTNLNQKDKEDKDAALSEAATPTSNTATSPTSAVNTSPTKGKDNPKGTDTVGTTNSNNENTNKDKEEPQRRKSVHFGPNQEAQQQQGEGETDTEAETNKDKEPDGKEDNKRVSISAPADKEEQQEGTEGGSDAPPPPGKDDREEPDKDTTSKDSDSEVASTLSSMTSSEQKLNINEVHKRKSPNHNVFFESNCYVPRSLTIVHRDDAKVNKKQKGLAGQLFEKSKDNTSESGSPPQSVDRSPLQSPMGSPKERVVLPSPHRNEKDIKTKEKDGDNADNKTTKDNVKSSGKRTPSSTRSKKSAATPKDKDKKETDKSSSAAASPTASPRNEQHQKEDSIMNALPQAGGGGVGGVGEASESLILEGDEGEGQTGSFESSSFHGNSSICIPTLKVKKSKACPNSKPAAIYEDMDSSRIREFKEYQSKKQLSTPAASPVGTPGTPFDERSTSDLIMVSGAHKKMSSKARKKMVAVKEDAAKREREKRIEECPKHIWEVVSKYLCDPKRLSPPEYAQRVAQVSRTQNFINHKFCLIVGDLREAFFYSSSNRERVVYALTPGEYGLTASPLLNPDWPKITNSRREFEKLVQSDSQPRDMTESFFELLGNSKRYPPSELPTTGVGDELEVILSSMFIAHKNTPHYGTRCSTVLIINQHDILLEHREFIAEKKNKKGKAKDHIGVPGVAKSSSLWHALKSKTKAHKGKGHKHNRHIAASMDSSDESSSSSDDNDDEPETEYGYDLLEGLPSATHPHRTVLLCMPITNTESPSEAAAPVYKSGEGASATSTTKGRLNLSLNASKDESMSGGSPRRPKSAMGMLEARRKKPKKRKNDADSTFDTTIAVSSVTDIVTARRTSSAGTTRNATPQTRGRTSWLRRQSSTSTSGN